MELLEQLYLSPPFETREQLEQEVEFWDATTSQWLGNCPRQGEYAIREGLRFREDSLWLRAGKALHAGLNIFYAGGSDELALEELQKEWGDEGQVARNGEKFKHLHLGHLEVIFKNYLEFAKRRDNFKPIILTLDDLHLEDVVAAAWKMLPDGKLMLGESKVVMRFVVDGNEFIYSGKPDLPIWMSGAVYLLDHKTTSAYLSKWYFDQYRFSNQLRGYCAIAQKLLQTLVAGALINGIYVGEKASLSTFEGTRFERFGPMLFQPGHLDEAIRNQYYWRKTLDFYESVGYYPQHASKLCGGCPFAQLCNTSPAMRDSVIEREYVRGGTKFLDL